MSSVPDPERCEQVQRGKPPPERIVWDDDLGCLEGLMALDDRHIRTARRGFLAMTLLASLLIGPWAFCALVAVILTINVMKRSPGPTRRSERARLLADCNAQHAAWKRGDDMIAFFGRFQPNGQTWPTTSEADLARGPWPIAPVEHRWNDGTPMPKWLLVGPAYENTAAVGPGA